MVKQTAELANDEFEEDFEEQFEPTGDVEGIEDTTGGFEIDSGIELGARQRNLLRAAKYPFGKLEVGQSFHVAATSEQPAPAKTLAGAVTNANLKYSEPHPEGLTESKTLSVYETDEAGKRVRTANGGYNKVGEKVATRVVRVPVRHFTIRSVGANDPRGPGARVFRDM